ncbi:MAG: hypothetical protein ACE5MK_07710 [Acidobacteriota bacterium]
MKKILIWALGFSFLCFACGPAGEHPGEEVAEEHPGEEHPGEEAVQFSAENIKTAMSAHIEARIQEGSGSFKIHDPESDQNLELSFVQIHDPVRKIEGRGYFACTDFTTADGKTIYDIDFWLNPQEGELVVTDTQIHKVNQNPRYTFQEGEIVEIQ